VMSEDHPFVGRNKIAAILRRSEGVALRPSSSNTLVAMNLL
jgi:hypothetical protein